MVGSKLNMISSVKIKVAGDGNVDFGKSLKQ